jgi:hypothetical protein
MNLAELQEVNKKLPKASKNEIAAALNRLGVNPDSIKVGDKLKFPAEINEFNGTITKGVVNGNTFFQVAVEVNGVARNVSINSLFRSFNDRENNKRITPVDILPEADKDKDKCIFNMFENKTIAECLADLQGAEVTAKAIESFESVARDGSQMNVNVIAYCKE